MISESELIKGCVSGKREFQEILYQRFSSKMFGVCLRYCKNRDDAEDQLQEAFIKVFTKIKGFKSQGSLEGWIRRIVVNTVIESFRKKSHLYPVGDYEGLEGNLVERNVLDEIAVKDLMGLVQNLSPGYRMVFNLYAIEGYTHKEIAEQLNISEGTSKSQLARARGILQIEVKKRQITVKEVYA